MDLTPLEELRMEYDNCKLCPLHQYRNKMVWGTGPEDAKIMIISDMPGTEEDEQGVPFYKKAPAGRILEMMFKSCHLTREEVYITNIVMCLPTVEGTDVRTPAKPEIDACQERLFREICIVDPELILIMGHPAARSLLNTNKKMEALEGRLFTIEVPFEGRVSRYVSYAMYNPAYLSRVDSAWTPNGPSRRMTDFMRLSVQSIRFLQMLREDPDAAMLLRRPPYCGDIVSDVEVL